MSQQPQKRTSAAKQRRNRERFCQYKGIEQKSDAAIVREHVATITSLQKELSNVEKTAEKYKNEVVETKARYAISDRKHRLEVERLRNDSEATNDDQSAKRMKLDKNSVVTSLNARLVKANELAVERLAEVNKFKVIADEQLIATSNGKIKITKLEEELAIAKKEILKAKSDCKVSEKNFEEQQFHKAIFEYHALNFYAGAEDLIANFERKMNRAANDIVQGPGYEIFDEKYRSARLKNLKEKHGRL